MKNEKNHEDKRTKEGKDLTLVLEHTMDMNENLIHFHYRLLKKLKCRWKNSRKD